MKHLLILLSLLAITSAGIARESETCCNLFQDYSFYIKVGSGISVSECAHIAACYPPWNPAQEGYNSTLGHTAIASVSIGCELFHMLDLEANVSNRSIFKYRKLQTPIDGGQ